ncbi:hypothetical protein OWP19_23520 [Bacillus cereus]|nr:hypothetical protein [Bacillus cereus]MDK7480939.1 hypothetical protein [Bacillus cereus]NKW77451.1 hypothetical protein [Bacillus cereus]NKX14869.1 hypothetical protein [Bacillus cereus]HDR8003406.1 hypothetical protein [Bacillus cereus]HDR8014952.1 hypothetical protein [Bacillus cereus]
MLNEYVCENEECGYIIWDAGKPTVHKCPKCSSPTEFFEAVEENIL